MFDYSSMNGFGSLGGMGGQGQSAFGGSSVPMASFDASSFMGGGTDFSSMGAPGGAAAGAAGGMGAMGYAGAAMSGLETIGKLWGAFQAQKMAKKQFKHAKNMSLINLANQVKSYNTALSDRARSRAVMESQTDATRDAYVRDNSLSTQRNDARKQVQ